MSDSIELAKELRQELDNEPSIVEFKRIKNLIDCDAEIQSLKKQIALAKSNSDKKLHDSLLERYHSHPLIINYNILKDEVSELLLNVSNIINKK